MSNRRAAAALVALVAFLPTSSAAFAAEPAGDSPRPPERDEPEPPRRWYGWQTLAAYGFADPMLVIAATRLDRPDAADLGLATGGLTIHLLAGPVAHFVHGNVRRGLGSFGLELLSGGVGAGLGAMAGVVIGVSCPFPVLTVLRCPPDHARDAVVESSLIGATIGVGVINVVDIAALAYDHPKRREPAAGWTIAPLLSPTMKGAAIAGAF